MENGERIVCPNCGEFWDIEPVNVIEGLDCVFEVFQCMNCGYMWVEKHP